MNVRSVVVVVALLGSAAAIGQQPPPPSQSTIVAPASAPGVSPELAVANRFIREGQYAAALSRIDAVLATDSKNPQARFLRGVVLSDQGDTAAAVAMFEGLTQDYPELPEPHNNLAVIWAQQGNYDKARSALETALAARPDYAIAHENLGDVFSRLAAVQYESAVSLDKTAKIAQSKLKIVRELFALTSPDAAATPAAAATQPKP